MTGTYDPGNVTGSAPMGFSLVLFSAFSGLGGFFGYCCFFGLFGVCFLCFSLFSSGTHKRPRNKFETVPPRGAEGKPRSVHWSGVKHFGVIADDRTLIEDLGV